MLRRRKGYLATVLAAALLATAFGCGESDSIPAGTPNPAPTPTVTPSRSGVFVYWDTNEEEDVLLPSGQIAQQVPPYDPNGQMCIFKDGRFVTGYNPTLPGQHNPGSLLPYKNPPVGLALWNADGSFSGQTLYVPGPYALPGSSIGGDIPPDTNSTFCTDGTTTGQCTVGEPCGNGGTCSGTFNDNGTFTGCAIDSRGDVFGADIGQAQGSISSPDQGRIIEWFPPDYTTYCIIDGPTQGGDGPHHVNGTGGLRNPGDMAVDSNDNLYVPESGAMPVRILKFDAATIPHSAAECGSDGLLAPAAPHEDFITGGSVPAGIAYDPSCNCFAVSHIIGSPAVSWYDINGQTMTGITPVPAGKYNPFGITVTPNGDVFFVDIALQCTVSGCGPTDGAGGVFRVTYTNGQPSTPERIVGGLNFPTSVTSCDASKQVCPQPVSTGTPQGTPYPQGTPSPVSATPGAG